MKPKVSIHLEGDAAEVDAVETAVNDKLRQFRAKDKEAIRKTASPAATKRLNGESTFDRIQDRDAFFAWVRTHPAVKSLRFGHVTRHDCREDEPEPVHLPYEHLEYQEWRINRDCRSQNFAEERWGTPEIAEAADPIPLPFNPLAEERANE